MRYDKQRLDLDFDSNLYSLKNLGSINFAGRVGQICRNWEKIATKNKMVSITNFRAIGFLAWVTDKKSSWVLIYKNEEHSIYTQVQSFIKTKWNDEIWSLESFNLGKP